MNQRSRRSSLQSQKYHSNQDQTIENNPSTQLHKAQKYIALTYGLIRTHRKEQKYTLQVGQLEDLYKASAAGLKMFKKGREEAQAQLTALQEQLDKQKCKRKQQYKVVTEAQQQQKKIIESEANRRILQMSTEFGRREQQYRQIMSKFMKALVNAQQVYQKTYSDLNCKCQILMQMLQKKQYVSQQNRQMYEIIRHIGQDIQLKRDNSVISRKQDDISFDEMDLGDKIVSYPKELVVEDGHNTKDNRKQHSSHTHSPTNFIQQGQCGRFKQQLEDCIQRLVCLGFFCSDNQADVIKMFSITRNLNNYMELLRQPIFPLLLDKLKLNVQKTLIVHDSVNCSEDNSDGDAVQLRNIENISQLSVNDSNISMQFKFRKKGSPDSQQS